MLTVFQVIHDTPFSKIHMAQKDKISPLPFRLSPILFKTSQKREKKHIGIQKEGSTRLNAKKRISFLSNPDLSQLFHLSFSQKIILFIHLNPVDPAINPKEIFIIEISQLLKFPTVATLTRHNYTSMSLPTRHNYTSMSLLTRHNRSLLSTWLNTFLMRLII